MTSAVVLQSESEPVRRQEPWKAICRNSKEYMARAPFTPYFGVAIARGNRSQNKAAASRDIQGESMCKPKSHGISTRRHAKKGKLTEVSLLLMCDRQEAIKIVAQIVWFKHCHCSVLYLTCDIFQNHTGSYLAPPPNDDPPHSPNHQYSTLYSILLLLWMYLSLVGGGS